MRQAAAISAYRLRSMRRRSIGGLVAIVVLIGVLGGIAIGSLAGARRTQSSYPRLLRQLDATQLAVGDAIWDPQIGSNASYDGALLAKMRRIPHVTAVGSATGVDPNIVPLQRVGSHARPGESPPVLVGSTDGEYTKLDRPIVTRGRLADPTRPDEVVMSAPAAHQLGMHIGSTIRLGFFTNAQLLLPGCCSATGTGPLAPHLEINLRLVGVVTFPSEVIEDDVDQLGEDTVILTPALISEVRGCCSFYTDSYLRVRGGDRVIGQVAGRLSKLIRSRELLSSERFASVATTKAQRAIEPESVALAVFGAIASLVLVLVAAQLILRQLRAGAADRGTLRALGADPATTAADGLVPLLGAVAAGAVLATTLAVATSPLMPLGPVRDVERSSVAFDWTVLASGCLAIVVLIGGFAVAVAVRSAPGRARAARTRKRSPKRSVNRRLPRLVAIGTGLSPGDGRGSSGMIPVAAGAVIAIVVLVASVIFGASLRALVSQPPLYGWNWNYQMLAGFGGQENLPMPQLTRQLRADPDVLAWSGVYYEQAVIDGEAEPVLATATRPAVAPRMLSGHALDGRDEIVLGSQTIASLHTHVGQTVSVQTSGTTKVRLHVVGTATMPSIGQSGNLHTTMGTGAWLASSLYPASVLNLQQSPVPGPNAALIRIRPGVAPSTALRRLDHINDELNTPAGGGGDSAGGVTGILRPAEIVNYRSMGDTPFILGSTLAAGAVAALGLSLVALVRRQRDDFAVLKTLGLTRHQIATVVAWQATLAVAVGVLVGVPIGMITGRVLWTRFATAISVVPRAVEPTGTIALVGIGAFLLANLVASFPGQQAARTGTTALFRDD